MRKNNNPGTIKECKQSKRVTPNVYPYLPKTFASRQLLEIPSGNDIEFLDQRQNPGNLLGLLGAQGFEKLHDGTTS